MIKLSSNISAWSLGMQIDAIHLSLQRPASDEEITEYEYLKEIFDAMSAEEKALNDIKRVVDLAADDSPARHVVYYGGTRREPLYNEIYTEPVLIKVGIAGANNEIRAQLSAMIAKYREPVHETFHSAGEFSHNGVDIGFKNITARAEFPVRSI
ncbi:MAG: hypothetical protein GY950_00715 [bacterium]|nr:hypothetical protein [bacterium]